MGDRVKFNAGEEYISEDQKDIQSLQTKYLNDYVLRRLLGNPTGAVFFGDDCKVSAVTGMQVQINTGRGYHYVSDETDNDEPMFKSIVVAVAQSITIDTADATYARKDIICIAADRADAQAESRYLMDVGHNIASSSVYKRDVTSFDYQYVDGTPAASPVEPSVPDGYVKIAVIDVAAGASSISEGNITDSRVEINFDYSYLNLPDDWTLGAVTTVDATPTDCGTVAIAEDELISVEATIIGRQSDGSARAMFVVKGLFYRNAGGSVTQQGSTSVIFEEKSEATWGDIDLVANLGSQTIGINVTGKAATTIKWQSTIKAFVLAG